MKRLFYLVIIVFLPILAFFQYDAYVRQHPPGDYVYPIAAGIDTAYHDPEVIFQYYTAAYQARSIARHCWKHYKVDVMATSPLDPDEKPCFDLYHAALARAKTCEFRLLRSATLKQEGLSNEDIRQIELSGLTPAAYRLQLLAQNTILAQEGDVNTLVLEIQRLLNQQGFQIKTDGTFRDETREALKSFQLQRGLIPSGKLDSQTLRYITH
ncbi:MAG: peptidoglycan-binding domain-containing protein [Bacteroidia bacterium]|nr:peptidoglycan-binding domain-containing protein [Bacteroidia bacterium]